MNYDSRVADVLAGLTEAEQSMPPVIEQTTFGSANDAPEGMWYIAYKTSA